MGGDGIQMSRFFIGKGAEIGEVLRIEGDSFHHITNVLRHKVGDEIEVCDGKGLCFCIVINKIHKDFLEAHVKDGYPSKSEPQLQVTLFQAVPKGDKFEWIIQKAVELGIYKIVPILTQRCVVKLKDEFFAKKLTRWQKIAFEAAQQSKRGVIPQIEPPISLESSIDCSRNLDLRIIPYEEEKINSIRKIKKEQWGIKSCGVWIGPEGGFEPEEIRLAKEQSLLPITLGPRILRTETAGMIAISLLLYEFDES
jgi:16S rRNA (uracil1498-N3)-methyltransferase